MIEGKNVEPSYLLKYDGFFVFLVLPLVNFTRDDYVMGNT